MENRPLFSDRVRDIGIPDDQLIVIGSGLLDALGLRRAGDVDLVLTQDAFDTLAADDHGGWERGVRPSGSPYLKKPGYELWTDWALDGSGHPDYEDLKKDSVVIGGICYVSPLYLRVRKAESGRSKDIVDIALLDHYIDLDKKDGHSV